MKGAQGIVKVLAITFAVFLVCGIGAAIFGAGAFVGQILGGTNGNDSEWSEAIIGDRLDFDELAIDVDVTNVRVERGDSFQVLADDEVIEFRRVGEKVYLEEKDFGLFGNWNKIGGELKVVLPEDMEKLEKVSLEAGAGTVYMEGIRADEVNLELGAGRTEISGLEATRRAKINGGAGYLKVVGAKVRDLDLDMGVGKVEFEGEITGNGTVDAGVGKLEMRLKGGEDDYRMKFSKGLGSITLNGAKMGDDESWGRGEGLIKVDGGVGAIEVVVEEE